MAKNEENRLISCPLCFREHNDASFLLYDKNAKKYYCRRCYYTGTMDEVKQEYEAIKDSYKGVRKRDNTLLKRKF